jgi:hypothetical protein
MAEAIWKNNILGFLNMRGGVKPKKLNGGSLLVCREGAGISAVHAISVSCKRI